MALWREGHVEGFKQAEDLGWGAECGGGAARPRLRTERGAPAGRRCLRRFSSQEGNSLGFAPLIRDTVRPTGRAGRRPSRAQRGMSAEPQREWKQPVPKRKS